MENLAIGVGLILASFGAIVGFKPREGRQAFFVGIPFLEPFACVVIVAFLILGLLMVATYFTTIDDLTLLKGGR